MCRNDMLFETHEGKLILLQPLKSGGVTIPCDGEEGFKLTGLTFSCGLLSYRLWLEFHAVEI